MAQLLCSQLRLDLLLNKVSRNLLLIKKYPLNNRSILYIRPHNGFKTSCFDKNKRIVGVTRKVLYRKYFTKFIS